MTPISRHSHAVLTSTALGLALFLIVALVLVAGGALWGRKAAGWVCDDTPYTDTVPRGRQVVGPTVRPVPGCGD